MRDSQRSKVYAAERAAIWGLGQKFADISECQRYINALQATAWWKRRWRVPPIIAMSKHHGNAVAYHWKARIHLPRWAWNEEVVLHEVAHIVSGGARHGRLFCRAYLQLVRHKLGRDAERKLRAAFVEHGCRHRRAPRLTLAERQRRASAMRTLVAARPGNGVGTPQSRGLASGPRGLHSYRSWYGRHNGDPTGLTTELRWATLSST